METSGDPKRTRVSWKNINHVKTFLEACIHEISINGREGGSLKGCSWMKVAQVLKETHDFSVDRKKMKNHYDYLKGKYGAWLLLKNKTGNIYDPSTNTFNLTNEEWEVEMKKNRYVETLRNTSLPFPDLCAQLFDGTMATGIKSWGPSSAEPYIPTFEPQSVEEGDLEILNDTLHSDPPASSQPPNKNKKNKGKQSVDVVEDKIMGVLEMIANKMNKSEPPPKPTFEDCLNKLNKLGWPEYEPIYQAAIALFSDKNDHYRDCWMQLKPELCPGWVTTIGRSKGFIG